MASVGVQQQGGRRIQLKEVHDAAIQAEILQELEAFGSYTAQPKVELGAGPYVALYRFTRAEQGGKKCRHGYPDCIHDTCLGDDCDQPVVGKEYDS